MKPCPYCAEAIQDAAVVCRFCSRDLATGQVPVAAVPAAAPSAPSPGIAAVLSFFIPGLGQIYRGSVGAGLAWLFCVAVGYLMFIVPGLILHIVCVVMAASSTAAAPVAAAGPSPPPEELAATRRTTATFVVGLLIACGLLLGAARLFGGQAQPLIGRVVAVADGDTITVLDATKTQHRVRLNGIDAPERGQDFGTRARQALSDLVFQKDVRVEWSTRDRYGRLIGTVWIGDRNANLAQLEAGLAWFYRQYERDVPVALRPAYAAAEEQARRQRLGLWSDPSPVAPWDFRNPPATAVAGQAVGRVIGNKNSGIYHVPGCRDYQRVAERNRVYFDTEAAAVEAGFRKARNCS